jgi:hypothetical protein
MPEGISSPRGARNLVRIRPLRRADRCTLFMACIGVSVLWSASAEAIIVVGGLGGPNTATLKLESQIGDCSATLIGPHAVLTAATCVEGPSATAILDSTRFPLSVCRSIPDRENDRSYNLALCYSHSVIPLSPERIDVDPHSFLIGDQIYLAGFGCKLSGGTDASFGDVSVGRATVIGKAQNFYPGGDLTVLGSALCPGDAGGPAFILEGGKLVIIGVNSSSDQDVKSIVSSLARQPFLDWAKEWSKEHDAPICGLDQAGCFSAASTQRVPQQDSTHEFAEDNDSAGGQLPLRMMRVSVHEGDSVHDVVARACGEPQPDSYYKGLEQYYKTYSSETTQEEGGDSVKVSWPAGITANMEFGYEPKDPILIPICASTRPRLQMRAASSTDTAESLYLENAEDRKSTITGGDWIFKHEQGDIASLASSYFMDVFLALNATVPGFDPDHLPIGHNILIPLGPLIGSSHKGGTGPREVISSAVLRHRGAHPIFAAAGSCENSVGDPNYPYNLKALLDALRSNLRGRGFRPARHVEVLVADTGVAGAKEPNSFFSDIRPALKTEEMAPPPTIDNFNHGTEVASLVLGGPIFGRVQALGLSRVTVVVAPIYTEDNINFVAVSNSWVSTIVRVPREVEIVNLSLETTGTQEEQDLFIDRDRLFVVAAGNDSLSLENLGKKEQIYPAMLGGEGGGKGNIVTVAAIYYGKGKGGKPELKRFNQSNYGERYVDIGAPGCNIPSVAFENHGWKEVELNGTSFAAPLVTFAAALIKSEAGNEELLTPLNLKQRLLASSDLHPALDGDIKDGRVLNLVKAVSLYEDIIELSDGTILRGTIKFKQGHDESPDLECDDASASPKVPVAVNDILKIWPAYDGGVKAKVYIKGAQQELIVDRLCTLPADLRIKLDTDTREFKLNDLTDVVLRMF